MDIRKTFLQLTSKTYPYGTEAQLLPFLPKGLKRDLWGNYFYEIGKSKTVFACHLDTCCSKQEKVRHVFNGRFIETDGKTILGADDKAGVTILLWLMEHNIPGTYYFFIGEEVGCIGSGKASKDVERFNKFDRIISFDRRDTESVITHQSWSRCCSDTFADALIVDLAVGGVFLKKDDGGVYTDSAEFVDVIPECTNLSVGYYSEHSVVEKQDIKFLEKLCKALLLVDWESLPTKRDPSVSEYKGYGSYNSYDNDGMNDMSDIDWSYGYSSEKKKKKTRRSNRKDSFDDYDYDRFMDLGDSNFGHGGLYGSDFIDEEEDDFFVSSYPSKSNNKYIFLKMAIFDDKLSEDEIAIIKDQYLDMNNPADVEFSNFIDKNILI